MRSLVPRENATNVFLSFQGTIPPCYMPKPQSSSQGPLGANQARPWRVRESADLTSSPNFSHIRQANLVYLWRIDSRSQSDKLAIFRRCWLKRFATFPCMHGRNKFSTLNWNVTGWVDMLISVCSIHVLDFTTSKSLKSNRWENLKGELETVLRFSKYVIQKSWCNGRKQMRSWFA